MSNLQQQRLVVEQLRREAAIKRITVRQAVADIMVMFVLIRWVKKTRFINFFSIPFRNMFLTISKMIA